jgi:hypothetical protein
MSKKSTISVDDTVNNTHLLRWIENALQQIYEGDVVSIGEYVVALLTNDSDAIDPKESCKEKLTEFLEQNTNSFVDSLFDVVAKKTYHSTNIPSQKTKAHDNDDDEKNMRRGTDPSSDDEYSSSKRQRRSESSVGRNEDKFERPMPSRDEQDGRFGGSRSFQNGIHQGGYNRGLGAHESWGPPSRGRDSYGRGGGGGNYFGHANNMGFGPVPPQHMMGLGMGMYDSMLGMFGMGMPMSGYQYGNQQPPAPHFNYHQPPVSSFRDEELHPGGPSSFSDMMQQQQPPAQAAGFDPAMLRNDYQQPSLQYQQHQSHMFMADSFPLAPEQERSTVRCTGVPIKVEEIEILSHFQSFGKVICLRKISAPPTSEDKKSYNEFLFQFSASSDAQRCINSPKPVLDNRFIRLHSAPFNMIPVAEVPIYLTEGRDVDVNGVKKVAAMTRASDGGKVHAHTADTA